MMIPLNQKLFTQEVEKMSTRDGYGKGLLKVGVNENIYVISADLPESTRIHWFAEKFPQRFLEVGVAEQNMASVAAGMAALGKTVFISSFSVFSPGRNNEQIRTTIAYNHWGCAKGQEINVKIASTHSGVATGEDGATHQALEDVALMRVLPGMTVIVPCDALEAEKATIASANYPGPVYLRFGRAKMPLITTPETPFKIGHISIFREGKDCTILATGQLVYEALVAAEKLRGEIDCQILNCHTIKPLDKKTLLKTVKETGCLVTAEEHQVAGGLGSAAAEILAENYPIPMNMVGVRDQFGESGSAEELMKHFGLTADDIVKAVREVVQRKNIK
ncbi:transketolase family protein [Candidatus Woesearchaeota archaeon]|nr:transketolase family protein [Candidatus Woesearchaeota archaeon]